MSSTVTSATSTSRPLAGIPSSSRGFEPTFTLGPTLTDNVPTFTDAPNGNNNGGGGTGSVNSTLYLFTFLTTLLLLLAVSCGIVIRSFVLRRRFHRRVEEAIAAGVLLPSQTGDIAMGPGGSINVYRRNIGEKPKMWEAWIDERTVGHHPSLASDWTKVQPLAVTRLSDAPPKPKDESSGNTPSAPAAPGSVFQRLTSRLPFGRSQAPTTTTPATPEVALPSLAYGTSPAPGNRPLDTPKTAKSGDLPDSTNSVQVAVFIAMPDPSRPRYTPGSSPSPIESHADGESSGTKGKQRSSELPSASTEDHEIPEICFGVAQAQVTEPTTPAQTHTAPKSP
ncbi:hypothetical protein RhiJN_07207 [Ceratobasidium sp. AG-Ba]|nr:hypothetical protein RhiJN_07207 [Ceratobasidium sp. AG-Ba]QRW08077.1 hypothetical protein RhiLY_07076 [Ceratobasidium sp. AG-Ba]